MLSVQIRLVKAFIVYVRPISKYLP